MNIVVNWGALAFLVIANGIYGGAIWWLIGRQQLLQERSDQTLDVCRVLLAQVPGKTAARTIAAIDAVPRTWWQSLRNLPGNEVDEAQEDGNALSAPVPLPDHRPPPQTPADTPQTVSGQTGPAHDRNPPTAPIRIPTDTRPDLKQAAAVAPLPADTYEAWKRDFDARVARDMAAIRNYATTDEETA